MVRIDALYKGIPILIEAEDGIKNTMVDVVAAIDYMKTREGVGPYTTASGDGKDKVDDKPSAKGEVLPAEEAEEKEEKPAGKKRASRAKSKDVEKSTTEEDEPEIKTGVEEEVDPETPEEAEPENEEITLDTVREAIMAYSEKHGATKAKGLIKDYGANKLSDLEESDYAGIVADARKGL